MVTLPTVWSCGDVRPYVALLHPPTLPPGANSHGKLRRMLTGTGVGSIFRFVNDLEWQPAWGPSFSTERAWWRRAFRFRATVTRLTPAHKISPQAHSHADPNRARQARPDPSDPRNFPSFLIERPTDPPTNQLQASEASLAVTTHPHTPTKRRTTGALRRDSGRREGGPRRGSRSASERGEVSAERAPLKRENYPVAE